MRNRVQDTESNKIENAGSNVVSKEMKNDGSAQKCIEVTRYFIDLCVRSELCSP